MCSSLPAKWMHWTQKISEFRTEIELHKPKKCNCGDIVDVTDSSQIGSHFLQDRNTILRFVDRAALYNLFQMKPTRCKLLLSIFISTSLHVSGNCVTIIRGTYCIYTKLVFFSLHGWLSGPQARQPPIQSEKHQSRLDTISTPDDGQVVARNMYRSWNKYIKK